MFLAKSSVAHRLRPPLSGAAGTNPRSHVHVKRTNTFSTKFF